MRFAFYSRTDEFSCAVQSELQTKLIARGFSLDEKTPELVIFVGGDGTFLRAVHHHLKNLEAITFVGVRSGTLGFFCDYGCEETDLLIEDLTKENTKTFEYRLLEVGLNYDHQRRKIYAVNEVRLENPFHTMMSDVAIDGHSLERFRGNGLIVCSSIGSSAYNKSLGGALIDPNIVTMQLTEIATIQNNAYRSLGSSLVLSSDRVITFKGDFSHTVVGYDHIVMESKIALNSIDVRLSKKTLRLMHKNQHEYCELIHKTFVVD